MVQFGMQSFRACGLLMLFFFSFAVSATSLSSRDTLFTIHGSNTIGARLAPALVQAYLAEISANGIQAVQSQENESRVFAHLLNRDQAIQVNISAHGSGTGFTGLESRLADIAAASRPAKQKEIDRFAPYMDLTSGQTEHVIAIDGLAIILHPNNPISQLSIRQVSDIFSGKISNWSQLGGHDGEIRLYSRDDKSGTWDSFKRMVLDKAQLAPQALRFESNDVLSDQVSLDENAIGFVGLASVRRAKLLAISDGLAKALLPTQLSVSTEDYALSRRLYFYTRNDNENPHISAFIRFVLSPKGQEIVAKNGFIAQQIEAVNAIAVNELPEDFQQLIQGGLRLTVNFRFKQGSAQLDNRALRDIERLVDFSQKQQDKKLLLIGFGDQKKDSERALLLSKLRAMAVRRELVKRGVYPKLSHGYGQQLAVASNSRESGRFKNRRVEVWLSDIE